jgi:hypothetical protein
MLVACQTLMAIIPFYRDVPDLVLFDGAAIGWLAIEANASGYR